MPSLAGRSILVVALIGGALGVSAFLNSRARSADFDRHADAVAAIGRLRHLDGRLSELVLAARFGLLNQYDPITETQKRSAEAPRELRDRIAVVVGSDRGLDDALREVEDAAVRQRRRVERFEAENAVLKNSLHYLPIAAEDVSLALRASSPTGESAASSLVPQLVQAVLVRDVIGDQSARDAYRAALSELEATTDTIPVSARPELATLLSHARVIGRAEDAADDWVKQIVDSGDRERIDRVEAIYEERFRAIVGTSNRYRRIFYAWSLVLLFAASVTGLQLRRIYSNLERLVATRTAELRKALDALWGEMQLASKIQQALLPTSPALENCDMAAMMKAAATVGGDYYDLVRTPGADWILIGDVSGHGVPAGLVMMMCHTAVRTLLRVDPGILPDRLLVAVNGVLSETIRQLGEERYMTICAFRCERDGAVLYSGAHQDIQILRAESGTVEAIETTGLWLGLTAEIGDKMTTCGFRLADGDVLLLHTDGVTEAIRDGKQFDTAGIRRVLGESREKTAEQVLSAIFAALEGYTLADDATVLAIRRGA